MIARRRLYAAAVATAAATSGDCILVMTPAVVASVVDGETGASVVAAALPRIDITNYVSPFILR